MVGERNLYLYIYRIHDQNVQLQSVTCIHPLVFVQLPSIHFKENKNTLANRYTDCTIPRIVTKTKL